MVTQPIDITDLISRSSAMAGAVPKRTINAPFLRAVLRLFASDGFASAPHFGRLAAW
jgi:hypothetical protein